MCMDHIRIVKLMESNISRNIPLIARYLHMCQTMFVCMFIDCGKDYKDHPLYMICTCEQKTSNK